MRDWQPRSAMWKLSRRRQAAIFSNFTIESRKGASLFRNISRVWHAWTVRGAVWARALDVTSRASAHADNYQRYRRVIERTAPRVRKAVPRGALEVLVCCA